MTGPFSSEVVDAVRRHMDEDHRDDSLLIVRSLGGVPQATAATMAGLDEDGAIFSATTDEGDCTVRVPWSAPIQERAQIRAEVVRMYHEACAALGIEPRGAGEH